MRTWSLSGYVNEDIGIYLGAQTTWVCSSDRGLIAAEPTLVAVNRKTNQTEAVGKEAARYLTKGPNYIEVTVPAEDNVIKDSEATASLLRHLYRQVKGRRFWFRPRVLFPIPKRRKDTELKALRDAAKKAGASEVHTAPSGLIAALGAGVPVAQSKGAMIVHIGTSATEISIVAGGRTASRSVLVGTIDLDNAIAEQLKRRRGFQIPVETAERVRAEVGNAASPDEDLEIQVNGMEMHPGRPGSCTVTSREIYEALWEPVSSIIEEVRLSLEGATDSAAGIVDTGILLSGEGALLRGLELRLREEFKYPVRVADDPAGVLLRGMTEYLRSWDLDTGKLLSPKHGATAAQETRRRVHAPLESTLLASCFISYNHRDGVFVEKLVGDLRRAQVQCFYAPDNVQTGALILDAVNEGVRQHDRLLLVLSENSVKSRWVKHEVDKALARERNEGKLVLFPVMIDDSVLKHRGGWPTVIKKRKIGDFTRWQETELYHRGFERLLKDLRRAAPTVS